MDYFFGKKTNKLRKVIFFVHIYMNSKLATQRIIGIDPGFGRVGWGVIEGSGRDWVHVAHGCIETNAKESFVQRLKEISEVLNNIIEQYVPTHSAVEELFFVKNVTTGIQVGQARGVILLSLIQSDLPIFEYTPSAIKLAVTGYGNSDKQQIQKMVQMQLNLKNIPKPDDAADGLAVAMTCGFSERL